MIFLIFLSLYISIIKAYPCKGSYNGTDCNCFPNFFQPLTNCSYFDNGDCSTYCYYGPSIYVLECQCECLSMSYNGPYCNETNTCVDQCINGICTRENNTYNGEPYCNCNDGWGGTWCDEKVQEGEEENSKNNKSNKEDTKLVETQIAFSIVGSIIGLLGLAKYYHSYREKKKFQKDVIMTNNISKTIITQENNKFDYISDSIYKFYQKTKAWFSDKLTRDNSEEITIITND